MSSVNTRAVNIMIFMATVGLGAQSPTREAPDPDRKGKPVDISRGKIPVRDFLRFLSDYTGLPVLHNSNDPGIQDQEIELVNNLTAADEEVVKTILEINGIRVFRETLPGGKQVMKVEAMQSTGPTEPHSTPIIIFDPSFRPVPLRDPAPTPFPRPARWEKLNRRQLERVDALNRKFEERLAALQQEHQKEMEKLLQDFSAEKADASEEIPPPPASKAPAKPKKR